MEPFEFVTPSSIEEAVKVLASNGDKAQMIAGGTDILVQMRAGRRTPSVVVDVKSIPELNAISYDASKGLTLGAAVPCYKIYEDKTLAAVYPGLIDTAWLIGGIQIQGRASIGGNVCNAAPSGDSIPAVIVLGGVCNIAGPNGTRELPAEDFCTAPGQNALQKGEMLVSISFPVPPANSGATTITDDTASSALPDSSSRKSSRNSSRNAARAGAGCHASNACFSSGSGSYSGRSCCMSRWSLRGH